MGAVGVVAVLLLIGLASIIKDRATQTESTVVAEAAATTAPMTEPTAADPLAEAGVLPDLPSPPSPAASTGNRPAESQAPAAAPADAPGDAR